MYRIYIEVDAARGLWLVLKHKEIVEHLHFLSPFI